jgi:hypothetical protein
MIWVLLRIIRRFGKNLCKSGHILIGGILSRRYNFDFVFGQLTPM